MTTNIAQTPTIDDLKTNQKPTTDTKNTQKTHKKPFAKVHIYIETVLVGNTVSLVKNRFGLVRFKGKTKFATGIWYGIELYHLILKTRHNGTICRKRYFNCPRNKGLFVRREQISSIIKFKDVKKILKKLEKDQMAELKAVKFPSLAPTSAPTSEAVETIPEIKPKKKKTKKKSPAIKIKQKNSTNIKQKTNIKKNKKDKKSKNALIVVPKNVRRRSTGETKAGKKTKTKKTKKIENTPSSTTVPSPAALPLISTPIPAPLTSTVFSDTHNTDYQRPIVITPPSTSPALTLPYTQHFLRSKSTGNGIYDSSCSSIHSSSAKLLHMKQLLGITEHKSIDFLSEKEEEVLFEKQIHASFARYSRLSMMTESLPAAVFEDIQHEDSDSEDVSDSKEVSIESAVVDVTVNAFGIRTGRTQSLIDKLMEEDEELDGGFNVGNGDGLPVIQSEVKVDDDLFGDSADRPFFKTLNIDELSSIQEYLIRLYYPFSDYVSEWQGRKGLRRGSGTNLEAMTVNGKMNPHAIKKGLHVKSVNTHTKCGRELLMEYGIQSNQGWCIVAIQGENITKKSRKKIQKILDGIDFEVGYDVLFKHVV